MSHPSRPLQLSASLRPLATARLPRSAALTHSSTLTLHPILHLLTNHLGNHTAPPPSFASTSGSLTSTATYSTITAVTTTRQASDTLSKLQSRCNHRYHRRRRPAPLHSPALTFLPLSPYSQGQPSRKTQSLPRPSPRPLRHLCNPSLRTARRSSRAFLHPSILQSYPLWSSVLDSCTAPHRTAHSLV